MRRRILTAILATVALSLVLAGTGTYLLLRRQASEASEAGVMAEAEGVAGLLGGVTGIRPQTYRARRFREDLSLRGIALILVGPRGAIRGELPDGVDATELDPRALLAGQGVSGRHDDQVWAAAAIPTNNGATAVVLTRSTQSPRTPVGWFLIAGGIALAIGAAVAAALSDSLTRPLRRAEDATIRIAAGDLSSPLPEPPPTATDEVASLTRSINAMATSLAMARGLERQFLMSVSHDLRTPLTSIRGYSEAIADGTAPDPAAAARIVGTESQRLERLVGDLLDLARLDAREFSFHLRPVDLGEVVAETVEGFRPAAEAATVSLHLVESEPAAPATNVSIMATVDPDRLAQAVANLVENALKYAAAQVWVDILASAGPPGASAAGGHDRSWLVRVTDDGPGIASADVAHVFDRLYVTDRRPARQVGGSGLGLAIVRELVAGMGGRTWAEVPSDPTVHGARLVIELPAAANLTS